MTEPKRRELSIILPRYQEDYAVIERSLRRIEALFNRETCEVLVVNDGGSAGDIARARQVFPDVTFLENGRNFGKGKSIANGVDRASGDFVFYSDIDLPADLDGLPQLIQQMKRDRHEMAIGTRRKRGTLKSNPYRAATSKAFLFLFNTLIASDVKDSQCPFKLMERGYAKFLFQRMSSTRYAFDAELIHMAKLQGQSILQVDIPWSDTRAPWGLAKTSAVFGEMLADLVRIRLYWLSRRGLLQRRTQTSGQLPSLAQRSPG
ncbi:glycosyltransferase family 2 protein [Maricaulis sp.]|uniref:glycosyltransferase family 2 protein n=1 Tax=Maricaulis sp. TaxID=1486257 RepID=UPI00261E1A4A|nr:glycosyltransferase family 2 protein [Maricaulis sp.]